MQRPDGKIATIYYFHDQPKGDRYIAATIWEPKRKPRAMNVNDRSLNE